MCSDPSIGLFAGHQRSELYIPADDKLANPVFRSLPEFPPHLPPLLTLLPGSYPSTHTMSTVTSNQGDVLTSNLRVATFSIALFDVIQTIPGEIQLYRKQIQNKRISLVCVLFIIVRYVSIVSLVLNGVGFYGTTFDLESCRAFRLAPPLTKMFAGIASQGIIFLRTWAISRKSRTVLIILSVLFVVCLPFLVLGNVYARGPYVTKGSCIAKQAPGTFNSAPMYYGAMSGFDMVACGIATYYLLDFTASSASRFTRKVLRHGMIYAFGTTFANIIVLMAVCHVKYIEKLGAFLSVAMTMIMAQHLVLSTQNFNGTSSTNNVSSSRDPTLANRPQYPKSLGAESAKYRPTSLIRSPRGYGRGGYASDTFELGVRVQTETHMETDDLPHSGARTVELQRAESISSTTGNSGKGVPVQYDPERGYAYDEEDTRQYIVDAKPHQ
ncbi:hypothetical protein RhiJN_19439 [Ceratobasidium sp. AG-Ba]|nr:hypothetical protein RhiJN_19439 [Ceratobasidium sp. AG-Ba]QRW05484.1 hypothetical protein RhiLY_04483 [Ceratobasidium sp. AG-Ba]